MLIEFAHDAAERIYKAVVASTNAKNTIRSFLAKGYHNEQKTPI